LGRAGRAAAGQSHALHIRGPKAHAAASPISTTTPPATPPANAATSTAGAAGGAAAVVVYVGVKEVVEVTGASAAVAAASLGLDACKAAVNVPVATAAAKEVESVAGGTLAAVTVYDTVRRTLLFVACSTRHGCPSDRGSVSGSVVWVGAVVWARRCRRRFCTPVATTCPTGSPVAAVGDV